MQVTYFNNRTTINCRGRFSLPVNAASCTEKKESPSPAAHSCRIYRYCNYTHASCFSYVPPTITRFLSLSLQWLWRPLCDSFSPFLLPAAASRFYKTRRYLLLPGAERVNTRHVYRIVPTDRRYDTTSCLCVWLGTVKQLPSMLLLV